MAALMEGETADARRTRTAAGLRRPSSVSVGGFAPARSVALAKSDFMELCRRWAAPSMDDIEGILDGLKIEVLDGLNGILPGVIYRIVPKSTLASLKKRSDRLPLEQSNRVYQTGKVIGFAMTLYRNEDKAREFLTRGHPMLNDQRPLDVAIASGAGADAVINLLGRGAYGGGA